MNELTIQHIAPYLPYDLYLKSDKWVEKIVGYEYQANGQHRAQMLIKKHDSRITYWTPELKYIKPVLYPMSDLKNEIDINGKSFIPMEELQSMGFWCDAYDDWIRYTENHDGIPSTESAPYEVMLKLFEWHFDFDYLIEKGLAVDVNDLEENPYA